MVEACSLFQGRLPVVQGDSARESADTLTLLRSKLGNRRCKTSRTTHGQRRMEAMWKEHFCRLAGLNLSWDLRMLFNKKGNVWRTPPGRVCRHIPRNGGECHKALNTKS